MVIKTRIHDDLIVKIQTIGTLSAPENELELAEFHELIIEGMILAYKHTCLYEYVEALFDNKFLME